MGGSASPRARGVRAAPGYDLAVVGHTNLDRILRVRRLPQPDRTVPVLGEEVRLGGTAATIARVGSALGLRTLLVSHVGEDFPPEFRRRLRDEGVDLSGLAAVPGEPSPTCFIVESADGRQFTLIDQGPMRDQRRVAPPLGPLRRAAWVHLTTGDPAFQLRTMRATRARGGRVAADPAQELSYRWSAGRLRELLEGSEIFFGNRAEVDRAREMLGLRSPEDLLQLVPLVVETRGADGAVARSRSGTVTAPRNGLAAPGRVTGAGDAFRGGFYAGWFAGEPLAACLDRGNRVARRWMRRGDPRWLRGLRPPGPRSAYTLPT